MTRSAAELLVRIEWLDFGLLIDPGPRIDPGPLVPVAWFLSLFTGIPVSLLAGHGTASVVTGAACS
jgi:hypothetical protein